jgi:hypothetical protein
LALPINVNIEADRSPLVSAPVQRIRAVDGDAGQRVLGSPGVDLDGVVIASAEQFRPRLRVRMMKAEGGV